MALPLKGGTGRAHGPRQQTEGKTKAAGGLQEGTWLVHLDATGVSQTVW